MRILILGAKGSLGQTFVSLYREHELVALNRADLDVTDEPKVYQKIAEIKPDLIINCAAYTNVNEAELNPDLAMNINGTAVGYLAKAAKQAGAVLAHFSTAAVFNGNNPNGNAEADQPSDPVNVYGKSKLLGEQLLLKNNDKYFLIRTNWLYGAPSAGKKTFIEQILKKADSQELEVINDEFSHPTYVLDLAQAAKNLFESGKPYGIYHLTNAGKASWYDWAAEIFKLKGVNVNLKPVSRKGYKRIADRPEFAILINTKLPQLRPWEQALAEFLRTSST